MPYLLPFLLNLLHEFVYFGDHVGVEVLRDEFVLARHVARLFDALAEGRHDGEPVRGEAG